MKMNMELLAELCVLVCSLVGVSYGLAVFFRKKSPLYARMITGAVGCMMFASLLTVVRRLTGFEEHVFQLEHLAYIGVFLFLLTANAGMMDGLVDDRSDSLRRYRLLALLAPLTVVLLYLPMLLGRLPALAKGIHGVVALFAAAAAYYNCKHAIIPDVDFGVVRCVRGYNLLALAYAALYTGSMTARACGAGTVMLLLSVLIGADVLLILPMLKRGIEQWRA